MRVEAWRRTLILQLDRATTMSLKVLLTKRRRSTVEFISLWKSLALNQRQEAIRAVLKCGKYRLKEVYLSLQVTGDRWYQMSKEQKMRHLNKEIETPITTNKEDSTNHPPSISYTSAPQCWLPFGHDDGSIECPCPVFKSSRNVCSHSVAVAEREDVLAITLDWVRNSESDCNLYNLTTENINVRASGQKGGKERPTRKTQKKATPAYTITNKERLAFVRLGSWEPTSLPQVTRPSTQTSSNPTLTVQPEAASIGLGLGLGQAVEQRATSATSQYLSTANLSVTVSNEEQQESAALDGWYPTGLAWAMVHSIPTPLPIQNAVVHLPQHVFANISNDAPTSSAITST